MRGFRQLQQAVAIRKRQSNHPSLGELHKTVTARCLVSRIYTKHFAPSLHWAALCLLLIILGACAGDRTIEPKPNGVLEFEICQEALQVPLKKQAFQGYDGWFFFQHDLRETEGTLQQVDFIAEVSRALATQGVALVLTPIPSRGVVTPQFLYPADPIQAAFSPAEAQRHYNNFLRSLKQSGVAVLDVLAVARAFDAGGGQTFFKRDGHWTPEGSDAVARETAKLVQQVSGDLPAAMLNLTREPETEPFKGGFIKNWLSASCGYTLPAEPLTSYTLSSTSESSAAAEREVVLTGSSFSVLPFYVGSLDVALKTDVLNASIGGGGVLFPLETYLLSDVYKAHRPQVVVWEFPIAAAALVPAQRRRLLAAVYGACRDDAVQFQQTHPVNTLGIIDVEDKGLAASDHYLSFTFSDLSILSFDVTLRYRGGLTETITINTPGLNSKANRGRFFTTLVEGGTLLAEVDLAVPPTATGRVTMQVCQNP